MPTKDELEAQNATLLQENDKLRGNGQVEELKSRIAALEGTSVPSAPARPSRPDEERASRYGRELLKTALQFHPDPVNYPDGSRVISPLEQENIELKRQLAEQGAVARDPVVVLDDLEFNEGEVPLAADPDNYDGE